jgi:hypothetical protein
VAALARVWAKSYWLGAWLITLACLSVYWSHAAPHLCYDKYWLAGDSGNTVYNAWQVAEGRRLYLDVFEFKTPLMFYLLALVMEIFGPSPSAAQWTTILVTSATAPIGAVLLHRLGARRGWAVVGAVVPAGVCFAAWPFTFTPWLGWLFVALTALALERALAGPGSAPGRPDRAWLVRAGMFAGLLVLTIQSFGLAYAGGATLALVLVLGAGRFAAAGWFVGGGVLVAMPFVVHLVAIGAFGEAIWQTLVWPNTYYYSGSIKGHYVLAGVVEHFQRRGACRLPGVGQAMNALYTAASAAAPGAGTVAFVAALGLVVWAVVQRLRRSAILPRTAAVVVMAGAGVAAFLPQVLSPALSDMPHVAFASLATILPAVALTTFTGRERTDAAATVGRGARVVGLLRGFGHGLVGALGALVLIVFVHRHVHFAPFAAKYRHFDRFVAGYAGAPWLAELTEPGDTVVYMSYGGWQYLAARRLSGIAHTTVFNDDKYTPRREWDRMVRNIAERKPVLMFFTEKGHEARFFRMDPTLKDRYFWNGLAWELREGPERAKLASAYDLGVCGGPGDRLVITANGAELSAVQERPGKPSVAYQGSLRGTRVFLRGGSGRFVLRAQPDGSLAGDYLGGATRRCRLLPISA